MERMSSSPESATTFTSTAPIGGSVHDSEMRFRALVTATSTTVYRMSPNWEEMRQLTGDGFLEETSEPCKSWMEKYIPDGDREQVIAAINKAIHDKSVFELEHRVLLPDGTFGWTLSRAIPIMDEAGEITEWFGAASDLTERHLTQARLSESEAAFKIMADTMPQLAWVCDADGKIVFVNDRWKQYFGDAGNQKNARLLAAACIHPDDIQHTLDDFDRACSTGEPFESEHRLCANDGEYRWFMVRAMPYRDPESGKILRWYGMSLDVHDRHAAEDQLRDFNEQLEVEVQARSHDLLAAEAQMRQMQKLEAIGQLTGGVAHDFNNLLTIIRNAAELLSRSEHLSAKQTRYVELINQTTDRAARVTTQLLAFARRQALKPEIFLVAHRVERIAEMLRSMVGETVDIVVTLPSEDHYVSADPNQFETALVNLVVNARDAMRGCGEVAIDIGTGEAQDESAGCSVIISVADNGHGIEPANLERVFEPFFTTKAIGKGTGLGLSQVYGFVHQSGGKVDVESEVGKGTTIRIALPTVGAPEPLTATPQAGGITGSAARVLLVEDNLQVGEITVKLLHELGYDAQLAGDAASAIELLEHHLDKIDVVLTDVVMPGMSGLELGNVIADRWPTLPVVLASGYSHALAKNYRHKFRLLKKPYSIDELVTALSQATVD